MLSIPSLAKPDEQGETRTTGSNAPQWAGRHKERYPLVIAQTRRMSL